MANERCRGFLGISHSLWSLKGVRCFSRLGVPPQHRLAPSIPPPCPQDGASAMLTVETLTHMWWCVGPQAAQYPPRWTPVPPRSSRNRALSQPSVKLFPP